MPHIFHVRYQACGQRSRRALGFTLIELIVVVAIIAILGSIAFVSYGPILARSESLRCMSNMRSLQTSLAAYIQDKGHWPQEPKELWDAGDDNALEDWWLAEMMPYDAPKEIWRCPTLFRVLQKRDSKARPRMHYVPTKFDNLALSPYRWSTQPWLIEIGNMHGHGGYILFTDGSIRTTDDFFPAESK